MDYQVSARKYRPSTFAEVIGQPHVVQTLQNAIRGKRVAHAYVFSGMRGVGKTTVARILAKSLNCERGPTVHPCGACPSCQEISAGQSVDVIEIDGASNTGVDDVRELRENVKYTPFRGAYRVYIIDEVHMLSTSAFNALLKTLEEPPSHVVFIFATTEVHKIPATILSRCQHFTFRRIPRLDMLQQLRHVADHRGVDIEDRSLSAIVRASDGSMRDALSLLDQAIAFSGQTIRYADVDSLLGSIPDELVHHLIEAILAGDAPEGIQRVNEAFDHGYDVRILCREVVERFRNLMVAAVAPSRDHLDRLLELPAEDIDFLHAQARQVSESALYECFTIFLRAAEGLRNSAFPRFLFEAAVIRAIHTLSIATSAPLHNHGDRRQSLSQSAQRPTPTGQSLPHSHGNNPIINSSSTRSSTKKSQPQLSRPVGASTVQGNHRQPERVSPHTAPLQPTPQANSRPDTELATPLPWETVMARIMNDHPNVGAFLEMGSIIATTPDEIVVGFAKSDSVARARIEKPETRRLLSQICTQIAGRPIAVKIIETAESSPCTQTIAQQARQRQREEEQDLMAQVHAHPLVKRALDLFGGDIVSVTRHSPKEAL